MVTSPVAMRLARPILGCAIAAGLAGVAVAARDGHTEAGRIPLARAAVGSAGQILFTGTDTRSRPRLYLMRPDGSRQRALPRGLVPAGTNGGSPAWSPDGMHIAMDAVREASEQSSSDIFVTDLRGPPVQITHSGKDRSPTWSPDGRRIAFSREVPAPEGEWQRAEIWTMNADGTDQRRVTQGSWDFLPVWSPDGGRIAFTKFSFDKATSTFHEALYVVAAGGGDARLVSGSSGSPAWSADGSRLAVLDERDHNGDSCYDECTIHAELYVMNADGSKPVRLTRTKADEHSPSWSPDGSRILFSSDLNYPEIGNDEIYSISPSGGCPIRLTNDSANVALPMWRPGTGSGPLPHAGPCRRGYRSTGRHLSFHTDLRAARRYRHFPLYWLGRTYHGLVLTNAEVAHSSRIDIVDVAYDDCGRNPGRCGHSLNLQVEPACQSVALRDGGGSSFARDHLIRVRGALVHYATPAPHRRVDGEGANEGTIYVGGVAIKAYETTPAGMRAIARQVRRFGHRHASQRLPAPRLPTKLLARTKRVERIFARLHSVRATARQLHMSAGVVRFRLRLAAVLRGLPRTRSVKCRRVFGQ
jgi:hypothetical protein